MSDNKDYVAAPSPLDQADIMPPKPPRARVSDAVDDDAPSESAGEKLERKRDYLAGFLDKQPEAAPTTGDGGELQQKVVDALKEI